MSLGDMMTLPHLVKPLTGVISILLFIFCLLGKNSWYPILIIILQLLFCVAIFMFFFFEIGFVTNFMWNKAEMIYSIVWAAADVLAFIIVMVQMFEHFLFWRLLELFLLAGLTLVWGFNAIQMWRASPFTTTTSSTTSNQATAQPPSSGINPGV